MCTFDATLTTITKHDLQKFLDEKKKKKKNPTGRYLVLLILTERFNAWKEDIVCFL